MSVARKDAFVQWVLNERASSTLKSGSKPTISQLRENALKFGYEIRVVTVNGAEVAKIRWNEKAQFESIDDFITNHQVKLKSSYLDLKRRLEICGVNVEEKRSSNVRQSPEYLALLKESEDRYKKMLDIIKRFSKSVAERSIDWKILDEAILGLGKERKSEFLQSKKPVAGNYH